MPESWSASCLNGRKCACARWALQRLDDTPVVPLVLVVLVEVVDALVRTHRFELGGL